MARCLLFVSLLLTAVFGAAAQKDYVIDVPHSGRVEYRFDMTARGASITGIAIVKNVNDSIKGMLVNEFGIKALAFAVSPDRQQVSLSQLMPMIDKWYVRRVLKSDIKFLFNATTATAGTKSGNYELVMTEDRGLCLTNVKYKITYTFTPIKCDPQLQESDRQNNETTNDTAE